MLIDDIKWNWKCDSDKVTIIVVIIIQIKHTIQRTLLFNEEAITAQMEMNTKKNWVNERYQGSSLYTLISIAK